MKNKTVNEIIKHRIASVISEEYLKIGYHVNSVNYNLTISISKNEIIPVSGNINIS